MTYCVAIQVNEGLVFLSDSRTNAGVDQLSTYSKMFTFGAPAERAVTVLTAGNLATTQAVIKTLGRAIKDGAKQNLLRIRTMDAVAAYVGRISFEQQKVHVNQAAGNKLDVSASFIVGGQIRGVGSGALPGVSRGPTTLPRRSRPHTSRSARPSMASPSWTASSPHPRRCIRQRCAAWYRWIRPCARTRLSGRRWRCCCMSGTGCHTASGRYTSSTTPIC